eukprot:COSAG01_NODE_336_length_18685_cov_122.103357_16_plen_53_part_00
MIQFETEYPSESHNFPNRNFATLKKLKTLNLMVIPAPKELVPTTRIISTGAY